MEKDRLPPIPTPSSQRWREFRIRVLPFVVFMMVVAAIAFLWRGYVQPFGVVGFADTNLVAVTSLQDGVLSGLAVERFQTVAAGDVVGYVVHGDPELIKAQISSAQAELEVLRVRLRGDDIRNDQGYQQFRQDLLLQRVTQAVARADFFQVSNDLRRATQQLKELTIAEAQYDAIKGKFDALVAGIQERAKLIQDNEKTLELLRPNNAVPQASPVTAAIEAKAKELELLLRPIPLKAPISGMISILHHLPGEHVLRGAPIVSISDPETRRIIGYIRQPVLRAPTTNDFVLITTRSQPRQVGRARILRVGAQLESINSALLSVDSKRMEIGLPILVAVPAGIRLLPGEFVGLSLIESLKN